MFDGKVFTSRQITNVQDLRRVFVPIALGAFKDYTVDQINDIGLIYEYYKVAGPRGINDMPMFFSMRMLNLANFNKVKAYFEEYEIIQQSFLK